MAASAPAPGASQCRSPRCTAERRGVRRELDSWRHRLMHCVGFESILEGLYGPRLRRDLSLFEDCEPEEVTDWSMDEKCSFCNLHKEIVSDPTVVLGSLQSMPTEEASQGQSNTDKIECQAENYLNALFRKEDLPQNCDPNIPLVAQELMKKMIRQFAIEYISKNSKLQENRNGSSYEMSLICKDFQMNQTENPLQEEQDSPLDLTVNRTQDTQQGDGVLDLSTKKTNLEQSQYDGSCSENSLSGRLHRNREDFVERSAEFADGLLSKALKDVQSGALDINKAGILYGIPQKTLLLHLEALPAGNPALFKNKTRDFKDICSYKDSPEPCAVLQKVALWAKAQAECTEKNKLSLLETSELRFPTASNYLHQLTLQRMVTQFKEKNESVQYEMSAPAVQLKIPQLRMSAVPKQHENAGLLDVMYHVSKTSSVLEGSALQKLKTIFPKQSKVECSASVTPSSLDTYFLHGDLSPLCLNTKNGIVDGTSESTEDGLDRKDNKQPRKKRGRYRQYDHEIMEEAIAMVMSGKMSVSKAQGIYGVPHSTLEYKVKERSGTLKTPPKKKLRLPDTGMFNITDSGTGTCKNSSKPISSTAAGAKLEETTKLERGNSTLNKVLASLCSYHWHQTLAMLKFFIQESCYSGCSSQLPYPKYSEREEDEVHIPGFNCDDNMLMKRCRSQNVRLNKDCLTCHSMAPDFVNTVMNKENSLLCHPHGCCPKQLQLCKIYSTRADLYTYLFSRGQKINRGSQGRSPSPPPLSPVEADGYNSLKELAEDNRPEKNCNQPPSLFPAELEKHQIYLAEVPNNLQEGIVSVNQENSLTISDKLEKVENADVFQDLMDRINEKLKSIETTDTEILAKLPKSDGRTEADSKLQNFITSLLHDAKANDYNFTELLNQHDKQVENKIIQTRFRKRQETLFAMHSSPNSCLFRRKSLQIKRELASLDETFLRKKLKNNSQRKVKKYTKNDKYNTLKQLDLQGYENKDGTYSSKSKLLPLDQEEIIELPLISSETNSDFVTFVANSSTTSQTVLAKTQCGIELHVDPAGVKGDYDRGLERTRHNIFSPRWCSLYVANNFLLRKNIKSKSAASIKGDKILKDFQAKSCSNENINKIMQKTNLHVVVKRLEDTINMAQKATQPMCNGYKILGKMKDLQNSDANSKSKSGLISMSETGSKGQHVLPQSHLPGRNSNKNDFVPQKENVSCEEEYERLLKPSISQGNSHLGDNSSTLNYTSPIKLMFLSKTNSSEGVKYTLTSVNDSSKLNIDLYSLQEKTNKLLGKQLEAKDSDEKATVDKCSYNENTEKNKIRTGFPTTVATVTNPKPKEEPVEQGNTGSSLKRKPGRPKKIGPQVVKQIKRPIGRPPKPKADVSNNGSHRKDSIGVAENANCNMECLEEENIYKNITVTVVFGRSRRIKRCVSEGNLNIVKTAPEPRSYCSVVCDPDQITLSSDVRNNLPKTKIMQYSTTEKTSRCGYEDVRPLESSPVLPSHCSNIRPNQKPLNIIRKPGRPAKVKISGISVTVNQISSQERKVCVNSCLPPLEQEAVSERNEPSKKDAKQCNKRYDFKSLCNDETGNFSPKIIIASKRSETHLRHSLRGPSLPFVHSLASSSSFSCKRAFLHKPCKPCLKNGKDYKVKHSKMPPRHTSISTKADNTKSSSENSKSRSVGEMTLDPIISSNSLRWWDPSISNDSLLKELNSRYDQITKTWLHVNGEEYEKWPYNGTCHIEQDSSIEVSNPLESCILELENSPIRMLFQKKCSIDDLCAWFMQTTETQSLSLVRKANARDPFEVISTRQFKMGTRQYDCNTSPLRKHFKKFALSTPSKSTGKLQLLHKIVRSQVLRKEHSFTLAKLRTKFENLQHNRWRQVKKLYNHGTSDWKSKKKNLRFFCQSQCLTNASRKLDKICTSLENDRVETQPTTLLESYRITSATGNEIRDAFIQQDAQLSDFSTKCGSVSNSRPSSKSMYSNQQSIGQAHVPKECNESAWRGQTFKDCRIFLKKINPVDKQHVFNKNFAICTSESMEHCSSHIYCPENNGCSLRSPSVQQSMADNGERNRGASKRSRHSSLLTEVKKSSKRAAFQDGPMETPKKMKKTQCKFAELNRRKRNKKRLCSTGQISNCYPKYHLGPLKPVGLPLLGGLASRAVEFSMIPFQLPLHGSSQVNPMNC